VAKVRPDDDERGERDGRVDLGRVRVLRIARDIESASVAGCRRGEWGLTLMHFAPARKASEMSIERKMAFPINVKFIK
jgi:hypothetical protein